MSKPIRLTRAVHAGLPEDPEVAGLLALMLLTDARRPARTGPSGELIALAEQDRTSWDRDLIAEGVALVTGALTKGAVGEYRLQAAVAAVHDEAPRTEATDWPQIVALYGLLERITGSPLVALNPGHRGGDGGWVSRPASNFSAGWTRCGLICWR